MKYESILSKLHGDVWATTPTHHSLLANIVNDKLIKGKLSEAELTEKLFGARAYGANSEVGFGANNRQNSSLIIQVHGTLLAKTPYENVSAVTNTQRLANTFMQAAEDKDVEHVIIDFDTNGGSVQSLSDAAEAARYLASNKKTTAYISGAANSAGYWLAAQFDKIVANPNSTLGSIGVIMSTADTSKRYEAIGIQPIYITSGDKKAAGADGIEFTEDDKDYYQAIVDSSAKEFYTEVANGRGISISEVQSKYGNAAVFTARDALANGLADEVGTFASLNFGTDYLRESNPQYGGFDSVDLEAKNDEANNLKTEEKSERNESNNMDLNKLKAEYPELYENIVRSAKAEAQSEFNATQVVTETTANLESAIADLKAELEEISKERDDFKAIVSQLRSEAKVSLRKQTVAKVFGAHSFPEGFFASNDEKADFFASLQTLALAMSEDSDIDGEINSYISSQVGIFIRGQEAFKKQQEATTKVEPEASLITTDDFAAADYSGFSREAVGNFNSDGAGSIAYDNAFSRSGVRDY